MMQRFAGGDSNAVYDKVTGNDSWIYCYDPETKRQPAPWVFPLEELFTKEKGGRNVKKKMAASFFGMTVTNHGVTEVPSTRDTHSETIESRVHDKQMSITHYLNSGEGRDTLRVRYRSRPGRRNGNRPVTVPGDILCRDVTLQESSIGHVTRRRHSHVPSGRAR
ncbi:hypothetical protein EVAR_65361_1 [Eumeta japonica]|uniref:Uncharacterized protein n=1 Tax=Eumeta variegata TaxID=151549 RepID=A0A4C1ZW61_EUMVA|nr:hypothetical protein EVAR_65361_1 [Eumeta japonica]